MHKLGSSHSTIRVLAILAASASSAAWATAEPPAPRPNLIETLRAKDRLFQGDLLLEAAYGIPANPFDAVQGRENRTCRITRSSGTLGLVSTSTYNRAPVYRPIGVSDYKAFDYDDDGDLVVWRTVDKACVSTAEANQVVEQVEATKVSKDAQRRTEPTRHTQVQLYPVASSDSVYELGQILMATGRGYGEHLQKVLTSKTLPDGRLQVDAVGTYGAGFHGTWRIIVDPAEDHLVRYARFMAEGERVPLLYASNRGTLRSDGLTLGADGKLTILHGGPRGRYEITAEISRLSNKPSADLLTEARTRSDTSALSGSAEIIDFRTQEPSRTFLDD